MVAQQICRVCETILVRGLVAAEPLFGKCRICGGCLAELSELRWGTHYRRCLHCTEEHRAWEDACRECAAPVWTLLGEKQPCHGRWPDCAGCLDYVGSTALSPDWVIKLCRHCGAETREYMPPRRLPGVFARVWRKERGGPRKQPTWWHRRVVEAMAPLTEPISFVDLKAFLATRYRASSLRDKDLRYAVERAIAERLVTVELGKDGVPRYRLIVSDGRETSANKDASSS